MELPSDRYPVNDLESWDPNLNSSLPYAELEISITQFALPEMVALCNLPPL